MIRGTGVWGVCRHCGWAIRQVPLPTLKARHWIDQGHANTITCPDNIQGFNRVGRHEPEALVDLRQIEESLR